MQNSLEWLPTKFVRKHGKLRGSRDKAELSIASRLMADLIAQAYEAAIPNHVSGRLLDLGCGKAPLYESYREYVSDVQCIDWSNSPHGVEYTDQVCDLSETIPYSDGRFETIILSDVLEHLPEPIKCWHEMHRLLSPGGKALINVPFYYQIHEAPHDFYRYTEFALRRFAQESGFDVIELSPFGGALDVLADLSAKLLVEVRLSLAARLVQYLARSIGDARLGQKARQHTTARFPFGYFMVVVKPLGSS